jgi:cell filamentation protein, protein adenylyltransferase
MFVEKRKSGKNTKFYLVHSYRDYFNKVKKIRRYLGKNLSETKINSLKKRAAELIKSQIEDMKTDIFNFSLTEKEINQLNDYNDKISIHHLDKKQWQRFTEEFVYNTNAIEGSTVLKKEVLDILEKSKVNEPEEIETKGVAKAVNFIRNTNQDLSLKLIKYLHKLCFKGSKDFAGNFRNVDVVIRNSKGEIIHQGTPIKNLQRELNNYIEWYKKNKRKFKPLVLAAIMHNQFENIHPFQDGNGRVGRLLLNFMLLKNNYPPINIILEDRLEYYSTLQQYSKNNDLKPTLVFLINQYSKTL